MRLSRVTAAVASTLLALSVVACGGDSGSSGSGDTSGKNVEELAKEEGEVLFAGAVFPDGLRDYAKEYMETTYGITVEFLPTSVSETMQRLNAEQLQGEKTVDLVGVGSQYGELLEQDGLLQTSDLPDGDWQFGKSADGYWIAFAAAPFGVLVNRDLVPADWPSSWDALAEDYPFSADVSLDDPSRGSVGFTWTVGALEELFQDKNGESYLKDMGANKQLVFSASPNDARSQVVLGQTAANFPVSGQYLGELQNSGANIELVMPGGEVFAASYNVARVVDAPHPNAAQLFLDFMLSDEFQAKLAAENVISGNKEISDQAEYNFDVDTITAVPNDMALEYQDKTKESPVWFGR